MRSVKNTGGSARAAGMLIFRRATLSGISGRSTKITAICVTPERGYMP